LQASLRQCGGTGVRDRAACLRGQVLQVFCGADLRGILDQSFARARTEPKEYRSPTGQVGEKHAATRWAKRDEMIRECYRCCPGISATRIATYCSEKGVKVSRQHVGRILKRLALPTNRCGRPKREESIERTGVLASEVWPEYAYYEKAPRQQKPDGRSEIRLQALEACPKLQPIKEARFMDEAGKFYEWDQHSEHSAQRPARRVHSRRESYPDKGSADSIRPRSDR
jgi:hypothetical protein